jgi:hypothetical protein
VNVANAGEALQLGCYGLCAVTLVDGRRRRAARDYGDVPAEVSCTRAQDKLLHFRKWLRGSDNDGL